jgi:hypothetical protein
MPNFIQISPVVLKLNHADRQTWSALYAFMHNMQRTHKSCILTSWIQVKEVGIVKSWQFRNQDIHYVIKFPAEAQVTLYLHIDMEKLIWLSVVLAALIGELQTIMRPQILPRGSEEIFSYIYWHFLIKSILQTISASLLMVLFLKARLNF